MAGFNENAIATVTVDVPAGVLVSPVTDCMSLKIGVLRFSRVPVNEEMAGQLGIRLYDKDAPEGERDLTGVAASCASCVARNCLVLDGDSRITRVEPWEDEPTFREACRTSAGRAIAESLERPPAT